MRSSFFISIMAVLTVFRTGNCHAQSSSARILDETRELLQQAIRIAKALKDKEVPEPKPSSSKTTKKLTNAISILEREAVSTNLPEEVAANAPAEAQAAAMKSNVPRIARAALRQQIGHVVSRVHQHEALSILIEDFERKIDAVERTRKAANLASDYYADIVEVIPQMGIGKAYLDAWGEIQLLLLPKLAEYEKELKKKYVEASNLAVSRTRGLLILTNELILNLQAEQQTIRSALESLANERLRRRNDVESERISLLGRSDKLIKERSEIKTQIDTSEQLLAQARIVQSKTQAELDQLRSDVDAGIVTKVEFERRMASIKSGLAERDRLINQSITLSRNADDRAKDYKRRETEFKSDYTKWRANQSRLKEEEVQWATEERELNTFASENQADVIRANNFGKPNESSGSNSSSLESPNPTIATDDILGDSELETINYELRDVPALAKEELGFSTDTSNSIGSNYSLKESEVTVLPKMNAKIVPPGASAIIILIDSSNQRIEIIGK